MKGKEYTFSTTLLKFVREQASPRQTEMLSGCLDSLIETVHTMAGSGLNTLGVGLAALTHIDRVLALDKDSQQIHEQITCSAGCAHCCKQGVMIGAHEAKVLAVAARAKGITIDRERLTWQLEYRTNKQWAARSEFNRRCVFLGQDDRLTVYEVRPLACRKYFSVSNPDLCSMEKNRGGEVAIWFSLNAECFSTAMITAFSADYLPVMMLRQLEQDDQLQRSTKGETDGRTGEGDAHAAPGLP